MRILVTGGLGFLGHHLCHGLLRRWPESELTLVDDLSSSRIDYAWLESRADIRIRDFRGYAPERPFDRIYHLASPVGSLGILEASGRIARDIVELAHHAGGLAASSGAAMLYVSSSETYGKAGIQDERDTLAIPAQTGARMEYLLGKLAGEHLLFNLAQRHGFRLTVARPFNIIGEHQTARIGFVAPTFFERAMAGEPLPLFYGGTQGRCFCHAEDMAEGLIAVMERGRDGGVYNLGNPDNAVTIRDLALRIRALCGSESRLEDIDPSERYGRQWLEASEKQPSIAKALADTGWAPRIGLGEALRRIYAYFLGAQGKEGHADARHRIDDLADRHVTTHL